jgi:hypothetical protein
MIVQNPRFNPPTVAAVGWYWVHPAWNLYQPLTTTLWAALAWAGWVNVPDQFGGHMNPALFHLAGSLLQVMAGWVLFWILELAVKDTAAALIGALLFSVHPIQVETIAFAGVLNNPLAGVFGLLAIWQYLLLCDPQNRFTRWNRRLRWLLASVALVLAMLAKPSAVVVAPMALILDLAIHRRQWWRSLLSVLPWVMLEIPCVIATQMFQHGSDAARAATSLRPVVAADAVTFYVAKILWPSRLGIDYGRTPLWVGAMPHHAWTFLIPLTLVAIAWICRKRQPIFTAGVIIFLVALLPNLGLVPFDFQLISTTADRYVYLSMVGVALGGASLIKSYPRLRLFAIVILLLLIVRTEFQLTTWKNGETLYRHALQVNPNSWLSDANLAVVLADRSPREAIRLCEDSLRLRDDRAATWNTLGSVLMATGQHQRAIAAFENAHRLAPDVQLFTSSLTRAKNAVETPAHDRPRAEN